MRLYQVRRQLDTIRRKIGQGQRHIDQGQLQRYAEDGTLPSDPLTLSYLRLTEAARACMDASVGGSDVEQHAAQIRYEQRLRSWQEACR